MKTSCLLLCLFALAGCSSPAERAKREAEKEIRLCTEAGYKQGTPAFDDCRLEVKAKSDQRRADRISAADDMSNVSGRSSPRGMSIPMR